MTQNVDQTIKLWRSLPRYEAGKCGGFKIETETTPAEQEITVVSMRQAIFEGQRPAFVTFDEEATWYCLRSEEHGTWMTTKLQEIAQMVEPLKRLRGKVLIGGLGLGIVAWLAAQRREVKAVEVIEIEQDVIDLALPFISHPKITVSRDDIFRVCDDIAAGDYDAAFLDVWQGTGEMTWIDQVVPLRRSIGSEIPVVICWQEQEMAGQVMAGLWRAADMQAEHFTSRYHVHWRAFRLACQDIRRRPRIRINQETGLVALKRQMEIEQENQSDAVLHARALLFTRGVGTPQWEEMFGEYWDEATNKGGTT